MRTRAFLAPLAAMLGVPEASQATDPADLCTGNPCVISASATIDDGSNLDFGDMTDLVIAEDVILSVAGAFPTTIMFAKSFVIEPGAVIQGTNARNEGLILELNAQAGNVELRADGNKKARIDISAPGAGSDGGHLTVLALGGSVLFDGVVDGRGDNGAFHASFDADQDVRIADVLFTGSVDLGGAIGIDAGGAVDVTGMVSVFGAQEGGSFDIEAVGDITFHETATIDLSTGIGGVGASSFIGSSSGSVAHHGKIVGKSPSGTQESVAALLSIGANGGSLLITGTIDDSAGNNGSTSEHEFSADQDITVAESATINVSSKGPLGGSSDVSFFAGGHISIQDEVNAVGGGNGGGAVLMDAGLSVQVGDRIRAGAGNGGQAGSITIRACDVTVESAAKLEASPGATGTIGLEGGRRVVVDGTVKATQSVTIEYDLNPPEINGSVTPAPTITLTADSSGCASLAECGNELLDVGEQCDDGNVVSGDCCSAACAAEPAGNACATDWGLCATSECDGAGTCGTAIPSSGCFEPLEALRAQLQIKDGSLDKSDLVSFKWGRGEDVLPGDLPDALTTEDVELCIFDSAGRPVFRAQAPAGGICGGKACWKESATSLTYSDKEATPQGLQTVKFKSGTGGKASAQVKGKGVNLPELPPLPLALPAVGEIRATGGACWQATFDQAGVIKSDGTQFRGKSGPPS